MKALKYVNENKAFTLIELLVVIGIIAILASILLPALNAAMKRAERSEAQTEVKSIETAVKAYMNEYGKLPAPDNRQGSADWHVNSEGDSEDVMEILTGDNPRKIVFLEGPDSNGVFLDPWDEQYYLYLDTDYDNELSVQTNGSSGTIYSPVVAYSTADSSDPEDFIFSFQK